MAEAHPVGFRWPMKAKEKGAKIIHVDPRFTRTSAVSDLFVGIRAGTDIAFLGGLINYVLTHERWFREYVLAYTNASSLIQGGFKDTEDLGAGSAGTTKKRTSMRVRRDIGAMSARKRNATPKGSPGQHKVTKGKHGVHGYGIMGGASAHTSKQSEATDEPGGQPPRDETLQDPHCVMQLLRKHFARYTPKFVADICGCTRNK